MVDHLFELHGKISRADPPAWISSGIDTLIRQLGGACGSVFFKDPSGNILYANESFCAQFASASDSRPMGYHSLPTELRDISRFTDERLTKSRETMRFSYSITNASGERSRYTTTKIPICDQASCLSGILGFTMQTAGGIDTRGTLEVEDLRKAWKSLKDLDSRILKTLPFVCQGLTNKAIASQRDLSTRTVELHRTKLMRAAGVDCGTKLVNIISQLCDAGMGDFDDAIRDQ